MLEESPERSRYRQEVLSYFSKLAGHYDLCAFIISSGTIGRIRKLTTMMLSLKERARVLDLCTGTGEMALYLFKAGYLPVGLDFSLPMLHQAVKKRGLQKVPLIYGDSLYLPFRSDSFDGACISFGLHEMPLDVIKEALQETGRILKPGGQLVVTDWSLPSNPLIRAVFNTLINAFENRNCCTFLRTDLTALLRQHGFHKQVERPIGLGCAAIRLFQKLK